jgi:putative peptidoglycan lipid II flippase
MSLARHYTTVGTATLLSRLTGFVRDVMIAAVLGSSAVADAYIAAFLLPNLFRRVLSEGAFNAAFVPIYARRAAAGGDDSVQPFIEQAFSTLVALVCVAVVATELFMPALIAAVAPGFASEPDKFADAVLFGRLAFVFVGAIVVSALIASILNAIGRFSLVALAPLALNFMLIAVLALLLALGWRERREAGLAMVLTVLVAGLAQLLIVGWGLRRAGLSLRWRRPSLDGDVRMLMLRILPGLMLAGAGHFNMVVAAQMSSSLPSAVSWLYYADRLFQLPLGFVAAAIGTVLLPVVSRALSAADHAGARAAGGRAIEFGFMLVLPAALSLAVLADPIVTVIYRHGAFSSADAKATAEVLRALAFALPGFVLVKALLPPYLARENIRTPLVAALAGVLVNIAVTLSLIGSLGHVAAPLGVAASAFVNAGVLAVGLRGTGDLPFDAMSRRNLAAIALASFATAGVAFLLQGVFDGALMPPAPFALRAATLAAICVAGVVVHAACLFALGLTDRARIVAAFRRPPSPGALSE